MARSAEGGRHLTILAIDPGNIQSAYVFMSDDYRPLQFGKVVNEDLLEMLTEPYCNCPKFDMVVIEKMSSYGMPIGAEVLDTCEWIGRYQQAARVPAIKICRKDVKKAICGGKRGNDSTVMAALQDRFGGKGTKQAKGWFYGFHADVWSAYAVGTTYLDRAESAERGTDETTHTPHVHQHSEQP